MQLGAVFPQSEIGSDPGEVRDWTQAVVDLGFKHIMVYDHVLGADITNRPGGRWPYTHNSLFHEIFVLFGYLAAITEDIELVSSVVILPQRQTALVAKQAAEVDVLSRGRLRLGIGTGWNYVEYESLNENFHNRGIRSEEQIALLRALWTTPVLSFEGRWHKIVEAGINPLPVQRPIPIWLGGGAEPLIKRVARIADGWFPQFLPDENGAASMERLRGYVKEAGRTMDQIGIEPRLNLSVTNETAWSDHVEAWRKLGATHLTISTLNQKLPSLEAHIVGLQRALAVISK